MEEKTIFFIKHHLLKYLHCFKIQTPTEKTVMQERMTTSLSSIAFSSDKNKNFI